MINDFTETKVGQNNKNLLDKNQKFPEAILFLILLKVSEVIPSIDAMYCNGT
ncbi:hypothetical protein ABID31_003750 [Chryseobacterium flavum]|uniref:hypothetical protein n=1 Tax=Chryseobacterium flavum TaxID=415851 RepID=UPI001F4ED27C|nr:hypothetical protein [Chryseobacterium flavum]